MEAIKSQPSERHCEYYYIILSSGKRSVTENSVGWTGKNRFQVFT